MKAYIRLGAVIAIGILTWSPSRAATGDMMSSHMKTRCPGGDRLVMVNSKKKTFYVRTDATMKTKAGWVHMCEKRAKAAGYYLAGSSQRGSSHHPMRGASRSQMQGPAASASPSIQTNPNNEQNGIQTTPTPNPQPTR